MCGCAISLLPPPPLALTPAEQPENGVADSLMASNDTDEVVIRRKRRRTAIDPCLGYYRRDLGDGELSASGHREKDANEEVQETGQEKVATSDSAQNVTSPYSEEAALITVDDFLRHQAVPNTRTCRKTYSHRKRRRIDLFSEDETDDPAPNDHVPGVSSSFSPSPSPRPATSRRVKSSKATTPPRSLRKSRKETGLAFSKRIRRAALLSHVDHDDDACDAIGSAIIPLTLAPFRDATSPRSPLRDRRIKYVDPRIPRQLDTSFANKENDPYKTKECRPFLWWAPSHLPVADPSTSVPATLTKTRSTAPKTPCSAITPLKLVPYEEHNEVRTARFGPKLSKKERKMIAPSVLKTAHITLARSADLAEDDPFMSVPLEIEPRINLTSQPQFNTRHHDDDSNMNAEPDSFTSDFPEILVPNSSQEVPQSTSNIAFEISRGPDINIDADALQESEEARHSETFNSIIHQSSNSQHSSPSHTLPAHNQSQKPMRGLGSMLDTFMETARSVLLSQPHSEGQQLSCQDKLLSSRAKRSSSRRILVSSPARHDSMMRGPSATDSSLIRGPGRGSKKVRKSISLPSVSAPIGHDDPGELKTKEPPDLQHLPTTCHSVSRIPLQSFTSAFQAVEISSTGDAKDNSNLHIASDNSYYYMGGTTHGPVDLLDLLNNDVSQSHAQIILSPPF